MAVLRAFTHREGAIESVHTRVTFGVCCTHLKACSAFLFHIFSWILGRPKRSLCIPVPSGSTAGVLWSECLLTQSLSHLQLRWLTPCYGLLADCLLQLFAVISAWHMAGHKEIFLFCGCLTDLLKQQHKQSCDQQSRKENAFQNE